MTPKVSLEEILGDFNPKGGREAGSKNRQPVTIWMSPENKARYDRLQKGSGGQFIGKVRQAVLSLIDLAESRIS